MVFISRVFTAGLLLFSLNAFSDGLDCSGQSEKHALVVSVRPVADQPQLSDYTVSLSAKGSDVIIAQAKFQGSSLSYNRGLAGQREGGGLEFVKLVFDATRGLVMYTLPGEEMVQGVLSCVEK